MRVEQLDHVALRVTDLERSIAWYIEVLGLEREPVEAWGDFPVVLRAGSASVALFRADPELPRPPDDSLRMTHLAFRVDADTFAEAREELEGRGLAPQFQDHDVCRSLYIRDPDGHEIEITTYEV